jgi:catechol 2,3-dioxygenase-like lactoylglutathione lyase family enzyme
MFTDTKAFGSFAVRDIAEAKEFYGGTLGLRVSEPRPGLLRLHVAGDRDFLLYVKPDHVPASFTVLNFPVDDIDQAVDALVALGVSFERYEAPKTDEKGIDRAEDVAWFKDPSGNILSVVRDK